MFNYLSKQVLITFLILLTTYFINYFFTNEFTFYKENIIYCIPIFIAYLLFQKNINLYFNFFIFCGLISIITNNMLLFYFQIFLYSLILNMIFLFFIFYFKQFSKKILATILIIYLILSVFIIKIFLFYIEINITDILFFYIIILYYQLSFIVYIYNFLIYNFNFKNINKNSKAFTQSLVSPFLIFFSIFKKKK